MERVASKAEEFGQKSITELIGPDNTNLFDTPGKLTIEVCKDHFEPQWANNGNLQFCIKSNIGYLFLKNSVAQNVIDDFPKETKAHWMRPGGGDAITFLIAVYSKNVHGTRASSVVAKADLLSM